MRSEVLELVAARLRMTATPGQLASMLKLRKSAPRPKDRLHVGEAGDEPIELAEGVAAVENAL
ncbi:hypothetical protein ACQPW1_39445 [Nocardia sp. CA-128927]|uniref:hypothetical protein n=1 Tax=Nocardia sp. CA-128927 TaxID=3239975 RepID=UPI003D97CA0D